MSGAYCQFCDRRCFALRVLPLDAKWRPGESVHLATCPDGAAYDREQIGYDHTTATNPLLPPPVEGWPPRDGDVWDDNSLQVTWYARASAAGDIEFHDGTGRVLAAADVAQFQGGMVLVTRDGKPYVHEALRNAGIQLADVDPAEVQADIDAFMKASEPARRAERLADGTIDVDPDPATGVWASVELGEEPRRPFTFTPEARADLAARLHALADAVAAGDQQLPAMGRVNDVDGNRMGVVPLVVHDLLCSARVASAQEGTDPVMLGCHFCGLFYLKAEAAIPPAVARIWGSGPAATRMARLLTEPRDTAKGGG